MNKYLKNYQEPPKSAWKVFLKNMTTKQRVSIILIVTVLMSNVVFALQGNESSPKQTPFQALEKILVQNAQSNSALGIEPFNLQVYASMFVGAVIWVETPRAILHYIADQQLNSIDTVAKIDILSSGIFEKIYYGLTIFALIGTLIKLISHFLKTERFDSVGAYLGFFNYLGLFLLFAFSGHIVKHIVSLNTPISGNAVRKIAQKLDDEIVSKLSTDFQMAAKELDNVEKALKKAGATEIGEKIKLGLEKVKIQTYDMFFKNFFTYVYFTLTSCILLAILAIPAVILAFMVKILLSVMVAGTKLVFLISLIPGFENTWKTFLLNMVNVLLWVPIFLVIMNFISQIVSFLIVDNAISNGQIVWLTLVCFIMGYQAITLTTTAAGTIVSGAGASMAGALSGMAAMGGVGVMAGVAKTAAQVGGMAVSGGTSAAFTTSALKKYMK